MNVADPPEGALTREELLNKLRQRTDALRKLWDAYELQERYLKAAEERLAELERQLGIPVGSGEAAGLHKRARLVDWGPETHGPKAP